MTKTIFGKVARAGKVTVLAAGLAVVLALVFGASTAALAAVPGDPFKLGRVNTIDRVSKLVGGVSGALFKVDNNGGGPALQLESEPGQAPLAVNAEAGKATNLDADEVDDQDASEFVRSSYFVQGTADNSSSALTQITVTCDQGDLMLGGGYYGLEPTEGTVVAD